MEATTCAREEGLGWGRVHPHDEQLQPACGGPQQTLQQPAPTWTGAPPLPPTGERVRARSTRGEGKDSSASGRHSSSASSCSEPTSRRAGLGASPPPVRSTAARARERARRCARELAPRTPCTCRLNTHPLPMLPITSLHHAPVTSSSTSPPGSQATGWHCRLTGGGMQALNAARTSLPAGGGRGTTELVSGRQLPASLRGSHGRSQPPRRAAHPAASRQGLHAPKG